MRWAFCFYHGLDSQEIKTVKETQMETKALLFALLCRRKQVIRERENVIMTYPCMHPVVFIWNGSRHET